MKKLIRKYINNVILKGLDGWSYTESKTIDLPQSYDKSVPTKEHRLGGHFDCSFVTNYIDKELFENKFYIDSFLKPKIVYDTDILNPNIHYDTVEFYIVFDLGRNKRDNKTSYPFSIPLPKFKKFEHLINLNNRTKKINKILKIINKK